MTEKRENTTRKVFISYAQADGLTARNLADLLRLHGCAVDLGDLTVTPRQDFIGAIDGAFRAAQSVIVLLSRNYVAHSSYTRNEWVASVIGRHGRVIPVRIDDVDANYHLGPYEVLDGAP